jgi:hypothetical protein
VRGKLITIPRGRACEPGKTVDLPAPWHPGGIERGRSMLAALGPTVAGGDENRPFDDRPSRCDAAPTIEVPGTSNIFGAGLADPPAPAGGGAGTAPPCVSFASTVTSILIRANGTVDFLTRNEDDNVHFHRCVGGPPQIVAPPEGPDGETTWSCAASPEATSFAPKPLSITAVGSISGISSADGGGYLIGVFLADTVPTGPPPATLDFTSDRDFVSLSPELAQTFFIGDGRTATGRPQRFHPPPGATRLYFGLGDAWSFQGPPGFYADNSGSLKVAVRFR